MGIEVDCSVTCSVTSSLTLSRYFSSYVLTIRHTFVFILFISAIAKLVMMMWKNKKSDFHFILNEGKRPHAKIERLSLKNLDSGFKHILGLNPRCSPLIWEKDWFPFDVKADFTALLSPFSFITSIQSLLSFLFFFFWFKEWMRDTLHSP